MGQEALTVLINRWYNSLSLYDLLEKLDMVHGKFECPSMDTACYVVLSTKEYSVHGH